MWRGGTVAARCAGRRPDAPATQPQRARSAGALAMGAAVGRAAMPRFASSGSPAALNARDEADRSRWWRHEAHVRLRRAPALRVDLLRFLVGHRARDDHVLARLPVHRRRHLVSGGELDRVEQPQHLVEVAPGGHRIAEHRLDGLVGRDDEYGTHGLIVRGRAPGRAGAGRFREHFVELGDPELRIADQRIIGRGAGHLPDVIEPARVVFHTIDAQAGDLAVAALEFGLETRHVAEFGGTDGREVLRMRKQHAPGAADPLMETNASLRAVRLEVGGDAADANTHDDLLAWTCERRYSLLQGPAMRKPNRWRRCMLSGGRRHPWLRAPRSVAGAEDG